MYCYALPYFYELAKLQEEGEDDIIVNACMDNYYWLLKMTMIIIVI